MLGLRDHPAARVEEGGRAVAPLLDVRRERGADEHGAHLLRDRAERAADDLELDVHGLVTALVSVSVLDPSLTPTHPGAIQHVAPSSSTRAGPLDARRGRAGGGSSSGPGPHLGGADRDELDRRARGPRSRSAPRARGGTRSARSPPSGTVELERLARVAEVGLALGRQRAGLRERDDVRAHAVAPLVARRRGRAPRGRPRPRARARCAIPSSSASAQACSGPAPPNATSANSRGSRPRSTETTRSARSISAFTTSTTAAGSIRRAPAPRPPRSSSSPPARSPGSRPSRRFASVTVGCVAAAPVAGRARVARRRSPGRRGARRRRRAGRSSRRPRRRCARRRVGSRIGRPPTDRSSRALGHAADDQADVGRRPAHVERDRVRRDPASRATSAAPTAPAAGPETSASAGCAAASATRRDAAGGAHHERLRQPAPRRTPPRARAR